MLNFANFDLVVTWVASHSYLFIFLIFCLEGPIATAAVGFLTAAGHFNLGIILVLSVAGDLVPDSIYYFIGYYSRFSFIRKIGQRLGLTEYRIIKIEEGLKQHFGKTMVVLKLTPIVATLGFMSIGYLRISYRKFISWCSIVTVPKVLIFFSFGYFFGHLYNFDQYLQYISIFLPASVVVIILLYFGYNKLAELLVKKIEK